MYSLAISNDGKTLAVGTQKKEILIWDIQTQNFTRSLQSNNHVICTLEFSPNGAILASGDTGGIIHLWDYTTGRHISTYKGHHSQVNELIFAPDGRTLASTSIHRHGNSGTILIWNIPTN